jgi:heptaprenyl diphosphate synthase
MKDYWKGSPWLGERLDRVLERMEERVRSPGFPLADSIWSIVGSNGKMLRPALLLIGSRFGKATDEDRLLSLAAAVELLHVATLIHDDFLDDADMRRGTPTLHRSLGPKDAVLAGDWLFSTCFNLAAESASPENAKALARLMAAICGAEIDQDLRKGRFDASPRLYLRTIGGKTAALFSLSLHIGGSEAKASSRVAQSLRRAGYDLGIAFQVIDDILDYESSEGVVRKPVGKDLREGLCTLPLIYAIEADPRGMAGLLERLRGPRDGTEDVAIAAIVRRTAELGGLDRARNEARLFTGRALSEIGRLPPGDARDELEGLTNKLLHREY